MEFVNYKKVDPRTSTFTLSPINVAYANTLRRIILTGVETVAFRADMTSTGSTTDVVVKRNDTPMTNEMLADRIGLLPINVSEPLSWKEDKYKFVLKVAGSKDSVTYVKSEDFKVIEISGTAPTELGGVGATLTSESESESKSLVEAPEERVIPTDRFFPKNPKTGDTCLIASLQPGSGATQQFIEIEAKATKGTGREHARFMPVSQCSYEYTLDNNPTRIEEMFRNWLVVAKKIGGDLDKASERYAELLREFNTMQIKRCYKVNDKGEPDSFDFTVESVGVLSVPYIIERACEVGENMCSRYVNLMTGELPPEISISSSDSRLIGYDFLIKGHDHTLGNLLQTWLVENHIEGAAEPKITYAGYAVPHPLRDEMVLRIGVEDGQELTARKAFAQAAKGCVDMFRRLRSEWRKVVGEAPLPSLSATATSTAKPKVIRKKPSIAPTATGTATK
jgi:DNA-directed RNA polymerase subunit L/DNA-directed RNA polymerase alpha subunit